MSRIEPAAATHVRSRDCRLTDCATGLGQASHPVRLRQSGLSESQVYAFGNEDQYLNNVYK